ncbi:hypothetical protein GA0070216_115143 [Micromonospora matsumotoense]|uniref:Uncharacterized protein n=1 Tax=Micromonospora matsumotoense TaxID=121616 RepID=A0A1C5ACF6_9ACTN|nr:hypothetical protein [Micromonospora matsumotoense]SCF42883.1 hypothetical protein GA0070216_115143 [Micromonospora matsumotoense]
MNAPLPKAGDLVYVTRAATVQFIKPIWCRVIRVLDWITYDGWCWLDVYQLDAKGDAVVRRSIFVQPAKLQRQQPAPRPRAQHDQRHSPGARRPCPSDEARTAARIES